MKLFWCVSVVLVAGLLMLQSGCCPAIDCAYPVMFQVQNSSNQKAVSDVTTTGVDGVTCQTNGSLTSCSSNTGETKDLTLTVAAKGFKSATFTLKHQKPTGICGGCFYYKIYDSDGKELTNKLVTLQPE